MSLPAPHLPPFALADRVARCDDREIVTAHTFAAAEPFFAGHFPGNPVVPGVLLVEAMAQALAQLAWLRFGERRLHLTGVSGARFRKPVIPGDQLDVVVEILQRDGDLLRAKGTASVDDAKVAEALLTAQLGAPAS